VTDDVGGLPAAVVTKHTETVGRVTARHVPLERDPHFIVRALNESNRLLAIIANAVIDIAANTKIQEKK
jgi:hypothetical protein